MYRPGDRVLLDDGQSGVVISATDDSILCVRTETGLVFSSALDVDEEIDDGTEIVEEV